MEEIILNAVKDLPFTVVILLVFYFLSNNLLKALTTQQQGSDSLMTRLIDLTSKLTTAIDTLKSTVDAMVQSQEERNKNIEKQNDLFETFVEDNKDRMDRLEKEVKRINAKIRTEHSRTEPKGSQSSIRLPETK